MPRPCASCCSPAACAWSPSPVPAESARPGSRWRQQTGSGRPSDGVRFIDLAPVREASLVAAAMAVGLGLSVSGATLIEDLNAYLRPRRLLLVLDNFEQVPDAAPLVADLLAAAHAVEVLVTSRTVLRISGEHEFPVLPLPVPGQQTTGNSLSCGAAPPCACSWSGPRPRKRASSSPGPIWRPWLRFAGGWKACRWRSSLPPPRCGSCRRRPCWHAWPTGTH